METAPLKSFATWARTALIREVTARIAVVLAPAAPERVEQPRAVEALEKAINAAGRGDKGRAAVADRVAYTWFNRIIALRFMDANGYTGAGVVSSQVGVEGGQPEILAEAKRGNIDATVVGTKTRDTVTALLNGTRRSEDPQGEAYALLLADYCRHWNRAMPFMFEQEGDFTELLIPANVLADESVLNRAVRVLTADVCQDVEVIGWLYQFYISERKDEVFAGFQKNKKADAEEIPAATQLFTPDWIVRYLVENSLGRLWMLNHPGSGLVDQMQYYILPADDEAGFHKISGPTELTVVDPACGSGHMLTYAFDLLYAIYEEEGYAPAEIPSLILTNNLYGVEIDPRAGALAAFALTIKARAKQRAFFNKQVEPNICVLDPISFTPDEIDFLLTRGGNKHSEAAYWNQFEHADTFGSLIQPDLELTERLRKHIAQLDDAGNILLADALGRADKALRQAEYLSPRYFVVVANPPYLGSRNMGERLATFTKALHPMGRQNLYSYFVHRAIELIDPRGVVAMILGDTWMSNTKSEGFRRLLLDNHAFNSFVHLHDVSNHSDIFGANAAFVLDMGGDRGRLTPYFRLTPLDGDVKRRQFLAAASDPESSNRYLCSVEQLGCIPGTPIAYWLSEAMRAAFAKGKRVSDFADPRQGLATADNNQFLRSWWEVSATRTAFSCANRDEAVRSGARWFPYNKGGEFRRWWGNQQHLVNWERDGSKIKAFGTENGGRQRSAVRNPHTHFQPSVSWSDVTSGAPAFRSYPQGFLHDVMGMSVFGSSYQRERLISFLNSSVATSLLRVVAPTFHAQIGDISLLPVEEYETPSVILDLLTSVAAADWDDFEISWHFRVPSWMRRVLDAGLTEVERSPSPLHLTRSGSISLRRQVTEWSARWAEIAREQQTRETMNNQIVAEAYRLKGEVSIEVPLHRVSLTRNVEFRYGPGRSAEEYSALERADVAAELVSHAVGCIFGRYSLDEPGLILADQGATVEDYLAKVPTPTFAPDMDNVIPIVDGDWFEDDVVARFRNFLRVAFGEQHFEENLRFVAESLGVKDIRDYFVKSFYKDHVQRHKKRPIYWLFSSPNGSFNALIYMHRYTPSTVSTVLNEYLREFSAKLRSSLQQQERLAAGGGTPRQQAAAQKETDRLRKVLLELEEYEHDVLYPLAPRQLSIDLDDGVKVNYPKFGAALKKIPGLEATDE
jgi:hypothetical protein